MEKRKVLITGVAGFIGSNLLDYLMEHTDWEIDGVDNLSTGTEANIKEHYGNNRFSFLNKSCADVRTLLPYNYVFHLAALPRIQPSFERITEHVKANLNESVHLLELMISENNFPRFIYSSSSAVYGTPEHIPTTEKEMIRCLSPYAFQKYEVEQYLKILSARLPFDYVCLRYFNPYGPRSFNTANSFNAYSSVVGIFLDKRNRGLPLQITGSGLQRRDFVHVLDVASANYKAAIHPKKLNTTFNIGNGSTMTILDLAKLISDTYEFVEARRGEAEVTFADIHKAREILGWKPTHNIEEYLKK